MKEKGFFIKKDFTPADTFTCGQFFRYQKIGDDYEAISGDKRCIVKRADTGYLVIADDIEYFSHFFDCDTDLSQTKSRLSTNKLMRDAIEFGAGIRILYSPLFEMIISFIISANNNIPKIKSTIEKLCEKFGKLMTDSQGEFFAFPTINSLKGASEKDFIEIGCGYRSKQIVSCMKIIDEKWLSELLSLDTQEAKEKLISLSGVGDKVANCVLLFGMHKMDVFPVDVWIERVYVQHFEKLLGKASGRIEISRKLVDYFGNNSGLAQQYLFNYQRNFLKR